MTLRELLERTLKEIDRQMQEDPKFTPERALIWTFAAERTRTALVNLYGQKAHTERTE